MGETEGGASVRARGSASPHRHLEREGGDAHACARVDGGGGHTGGRAWRGSR
jgi:hypothetical protein